MEYKNFYKKLLDEGCGCEESNEGYANGSTFKTTTSDFDDVEKLKKIQEIVSLLEKNIPTSPDKWARAKAAARAKFKVYPSAYANLWAAKKYKSMGGGWKKGK